jgi:hypothetical protein
MPLPIHMRRVRGLVRWGLLAAGMRVHASLPSEARPPWPHRPLRSAYRRGTIGDSTRIRPLSGSRPPPSSACPEAAATGIRAHNDVAPPAFVHLDEAAPPTCVHLGKAVASGFRRDPWDHSVVTTLSVRAACVRPPT